MSQGVEAIAGGSPAPAVTVPERAALFFDVDGTLVWLDRSRVPEGGSFADLGPSEGVQDAFRALHERGHLAFLCTGRSLSIVNDKIMGLGFDGAISGGGSCVTVGDEIIHEDVIERDLLLELVRRILDMDASVLFESRETPVIVSSRPGASSIFPEIPVAHSLEELERVARALSFCKFEQGGPLKGESIFERDSIASLVREHFDVYDMGMSMEAALKGVTKGSGIARVLRHVGHGPENTYAFGDSENDLPMFHAVQVKVAMGNSLPALLEQADYVTSCVKDDGVPHALRHFHLI